MNSKFWIAHQPLSQTSPNNRYAMRGRNINKPQISIGNAGLVKLIWKLSKRKVLPGRHPFIVISF